MKVTVKDCLELEIFKGAELVAGASGLGNRVKAVSVLETCQTEEMYEYLLHGSELIMASFFSIRDDIEQQCRVLQALADKNEGALVLFNVGQVVPEVHKKVKDKADELAMPLITISGGKELSHSDVISAVMEKLLYGETFANRLISNTIFHLLNFEKYSSFSAAARQAAINNNFQIVLFSEDFNQVFTVETQYKATIEDAIRKAVDKDIDKNQIYTMINVEGVLTYWGPLKVDGVKYYLMLVDNEDTYSPGEITKLAEIMELAMGMWKFSPSRDITAEFIKALRRGNRSLAYRLKEETGFKDEVPDGVMIVSGLDKEESLKIITSFEKEAGIRILKIAEDDLLCGVVLKIAARLKDTVNWEALWERLEGAGASSIYHVDGTEGIDGACDGFQLINEAWPYMELIFPHKKTFTKYELALAGNCIDISQKGGLVKKQYMDLIAPFKSMGEGKGRQLLETLGIFILDAGMNTTKTAKMMELHTNTVQYRLKRIKEMLGVDIMGNTVVPGLMVALAIERIDKISKK